MKVLRVDNPHFIGMYPHYTVTCQKGCWWWKTYPQFDAYKRDGNWCWVDSGEVIARYEIRQALEAALARREYLINIGQIRWGL